LNLIVSQVSQKPDHQIPLDGKIVPWGDLPFYLAITGIGAKPFWKPLDFIGPQIQEGQRLPISV
jgi:hypothetical protein